MAYIILNNKKTITISAEKANQMWLVLNGYIEGTEEQQDFCSKVSKIYLNWRKAPPEWIKENIELYREKAKDEWYVDNQGNPTRPQHNEDWERIKKHGIN